MEEESTPVESTEEVSTEAVEESERGNSTLAGEDERLVDESAEDNQDETQSNTSEESSDDELEAWAKSQNLDLSSPEDAKKLAKRLKDTQKALHTKTTEQSSLRKQMGAQADAVATDSVDPFEQRLVGLETEIRRQALENSVIRFYADNPDARALDKDMAAIVEAKPWLANDLDTLYLVARSQKQDITTTAKEEGRQGALKSIDTKQRASAPKSSATTGESAKEITDEDIANMSLEEYKTNREEILRKAGIH